MVSSRKPRKEQILAEPPSLSQIIDDLRGLGIEELTQPIRVESKGKVINIKMANTPTEDELQSILAVEEQKGQAWIASIKCEILSRAITEVNGVDFKALRNTFIEDPATGEERMFQAFFRDMIMGWGQEVRDVLWKVLMVHCQRIEDRLFESLPDSQIMTDVEKRFLSQAMEEIQEAQREVYQEAAKELILGDSRES